MADEGTKPGALVGDRFLLNRRIGAGGMAVVWLATELATRRPVALKLLHPKYRMSGRLIERLGREAQALTELEHPNIVRAIDVQLDRAQPFFAMEYFEGATLEDGLGLRAAVDDYYPYDALRRVFEQMCSAVSAAHARGIVHRDLKPSNVILVDGEVKILDFGLAKFLDATEAGTTEGRVIGSFGYMSPEQATGQRIDERTDVFSLGIILFEMLTLRRIWARGEVGQFLRAYAEPVRAHSHNTPAQLVFRITSDARPMPSQLRPNLDRAFDDVVALALAIDREARFPSPAALFAALPVDPQEHDGTLVTQVGGRSDGQTIVRPTDGDPAPPPIDDAPVRPRSYDPIASDDPTRTAPASPLTAPDDDEVSDRAIEVAPPRFAPIPPQPKAGFRFGPVVALVAVAGIVAGIALARMGNADPIVAAPLSDESVTARGGPTAVAATPRPEAPPTASTAPATTPTTELAPTVRPTVRPNKPSAADTPVTARPANGDIERLRAMARSLRREPSNIEGLTKLADEVRRAASKVDDVTARARIERLVASSALTGEVDGIERAITDLETRLR